MGSVSSGFRGWHVPDEQNICRSCGVVAFPSEIFCLSCGAYMGWEMTGGSPGSRPGPRAYGVSEPTSATDSPVDFPEAAHGTAWAARQDSDDPVPGGAEALGTASRGPGAGPASTHPTRPAQPGWGWAEGLAQPGLPTGLAGERFRPDPLFTQPTALSPFTVCPEPATDRPHFTTPPETSLHAAAPVAAERQVINGEVVLWPLPELVQASAPSPSREGTHTPSPATRVPHLLLCPECGSPNAASRAYCHPCGALLRPEPESPELTRWQRLYKEHLERPDVWHRDRRWGLLLAALPLCTVAAVSTGGAAAAAQRAVPLAKDRFLSHYAVAPESVTASSSARGFEAHLASNGIDNKAWAPASRGKDAVGQWWTATFESPFRLTSIVLVNGASKKPEQFFGTGRPMKITVTATTTDQGNVEKEIELGGHPGPQRFDLGIGKVIAVQVKIDAVHPGLKPNMPVAMAEIQFFSRRES